jgi:hypothetical protein
MASSDYKFPASPPKEALDYFTSKKLKPSFDYRDVWREEHGYAFTVAKAMELDLLDDVHQALSDNLAAGQTFQHFKKTLTPILQKKGWWGVQDMVDPITGEMRTVQLGSPRRLKVIYDTNMRAAYAAGQWERIQRGKKTHPFLIYGLGPSEHHRVQHAQWAGKILPVDDPFWSSHYPPNGWGCKCHVRAISAREAERRGGVSPSPPIVKKEWVNKRTGEIMQVPVGIDPGFDINPGIARSAHLQQVVTTKINAAKPAVAQAAVRELIQGKPFAQFLAKPTGEWPVAALSADMQQRLGSTVNAVMLSAETLRKQQANHPELTTDEYRLVHEIIGTGMVIRELDKVLLFFSDAPRIYKAVLKTTKSGNGLFLSSFFRAQPDDIKRALAKGELIKDQEK